MKKVSLRTAMVLALAMMVSSYGLAHSEEEKSGAQKAIDYRTAAMTILSWNLKPMGAMVKGKIAFDQAVFTAHAKDLAAAAHLDILSGFPEDSDEGDDTAAKPEIWMDWEDFEDKLKVLRSESKKLAEVAAGGDRAATEEQFGKTAKTCKGCHKEYKE